MRQEAILEIIQANTVALSNSRTATDAANTLISKFFEDCKPTLDRHDEILGKDEKSGLRGIVGQDHLLLYGDNTHPFGLRQLVYMLCVVVPAAITMGVSAAVLLFSWHGDLLVQFLRARVGAQ